MATFSNQNKNTTTFTNQNKNTISPTNVSKNTATFTNTSKNSASMKDTLKSNRAWSYNSPTITYNGATESSTGLTVYYNSLGTASTWTNQTKN